MHIPTIFVATLAVATHGVIATPAAASKWTNTATVEKLKEWRVSQGLSAVPDTSSVPGGVLLGKRDCVTDCYDYWCGNVQLDYTFFWRVVLYAARTEENTLLTRHIVVAGCLANAAWAAKSRTQALARPLQIVTGNRAEIFLLGLVSYVL